MAVDEKPSVWAFRNREAETMSRASKDHGQTSQATYGVWVTPNRISSGLPLPSSSRVSLQPLGALVRPVQLSSVATWWVPQGLHQGWPLGPKYQGSGPSPGGQVTQRAGVSPQLCFRVKYKREGVVTPRGQSGIRETQGLALRPRPLTFVVQCDPCPSPSCRA